VVDGGAGDDVEVWGAGAPCLKEVPTWGWRWRRRGPSGGGNERVPAVVDCTPVASLAVWQRFSAREMKFCQVILGRKAGP
jgi:hypothetical protein